MKYCDVIIPIYNAYEATVECIESVIKNTEFTKNKLYLINDKSPDEKIKPMLEKYSKKYNFINFIDNEINLGFVGTVNKGMKISNNDVVLLNSDTVVTKNWLKKLMDCAYSEPNVATVTPLSNNATLVSVPNGLQRNEMPENMSLDEYANLIEKIAYNERNELPTSHGFCVYIRRNVIENIGYFDEESFGKGYGEENDFSYRCLDYGYINLLCDDTIVFHKEKQSFKQTRNEVLDEHMKILKKRYPVYTTRTETWCEKFPIKHICENIKYEMQLNNRKNILYVIHDFSNYKNNVGGTTIHILDMINSLRDKYNFHVLAPENNIYKLYSFFENEESVLNFEAIDRCTGINTYNKNYKKMVEQIIDGFRIDTLHIHHMINHYFDIIDVAKNKGVHTMITLHDFYSICPTINLLYMNEKYCPRLKEKNCEKCLKMKTPLNNNIVPVWQDNWRKFLKKFDEVIVPSDNTKEELSKIYDDIKIKVIEHGIDLKKTDYEPSLDNDIINIAFVGVMSLHKGGKILEELIKNTKNSKIKYHLFGDSEFKSLKKNKTNYIFHGRYKREELPNLLKENKINLICSFSIWAETYSYTLTEEIASGVPVISFDIGAVADRIIKNKFGYVIKLESSIQDIIDEFDKIIDDKKGYNEIVNNIKKYKIKTVKEMTDEYIDYYDTKDKIKISNKTINELKHIIKNAYGVKESLNYIEADRIMNSLRWKLVSKIDLPDSVKKVVRKVIRR